MDYKTITFTGSNPRDIAIQVLEWIKLKVKTLLNGGLYLYEQPISGQPQLGISNKTPAPPLIVFYRVENDTESFRIFYGQGTAIFTKEEVTTPAGEYQVDVEYIETTTLFTIRRVLGGRTDKPIKQLPLCVVKDSSTSISTEFAASTIDNVEYRSPIIGVSGATWKSTSTYALESGEVALWPAQFGIYSLNDVYSIATNDATFPVTFGTFTVSGIGEFFLFYAKGSERYALKL